VSRLSRTLGRGEGSVIGGEVALRIDPSLARRMAAPMSVALVSGTNGKTTTTTLLAAGLATVADTATNRTGANLPNGLTGALMGDPDATYAALEVDEGYVPWALRELEPAALVLLNLSRDQLDRLNEVRGTADRWRMALAERSPGLVVANADDPLVVWAVVGTDQPGDAIASRTVWVGAGLAWQLDASACPWCEADLRFDAGGWHCPSCGRTRPACDYALADGSVVRADGGRVDLGLALPGRSALANATMAFAVIAGLGLTTDAAVRAWAAIRSIEGRYQHVAYEGADLVLHLAKNPAGWSDLLDLVAAGTGTLVLVLNAQGQDGRDPSWIWDVPFEQLRGRRALCLGERGSDLAVRADYAGLDVTRVASLAEAARAAGPGPVDLIANYSAFQQVRAELARVAT
jgi:lipid II isoglutaminyl synthase (glutamine-hydrolysing)